MPRKGVILVILVIIGPLLVDYWPIWAFLVGTMGQEKALLQLQGHLRDLHIGQISTFLTSTGARRRHFDCQGTMKVKHDFFRATRYIGHFLALLTNSSKCACETQWSVEVLGGF